MKNRTLILSVAALVGLGVAAPLALHLRAGPSDGAAPAVPPPPSVTVAAVESRTLVESEEFTGRVEAVESVDLRAEVGGRISAVHFKAGQIVAAGDALFTIDPRTYEAAQAAAGAAVARARALADTAAKEAARAETLLAREAVSTEEADLRRSRAAEAAADLLAARAELDRTTLDLERTAVRAPIAGRVSRALVTTGNLVSPATPLTTLVSTGEAYVYADVAEASVLRFQRLLREGRIEKDATGRIPVRLGLSDETGYPRAGHIESTDNRLSAATGTLLVRMTFPNTDEALVPGLFARVRIPLGAPQPTLLINDRAVGTDQSQKFVLTVDESGKASYRPVVLGGLVDGRRVVRAGLSLGEHVIVNGLQRVRPGMTVAAELETKASSSGAAPSGAALARN